MSQWPAGPGEPTDGDLDVDHVLERWAEIDEWGHAVPSDAAPDSGDSSTGGDE